MKYYYFLPSLFVVLLMAGFRNLSNPFNSDLTLDTIQLTEADLPAGYKLVDDQHCKSIQAALFYENPALYEFMIGKVKSKSYQSFSSENDNGTILYFEFEEPFEQTVFLESLLWGGSKPTKAHPEAYLVKGNFLIIWSTDQKSELRKLSRSKIKKME